MDLGELALMPRWDWSRFQGSAEVLKWAKRDLGHIADVLALSVDDAAKFLADLPAASRSLETLRDVGLGYLRLGQPATELSGGEAQRIKLATELQRARRGHGHRQGGLQPGRLRVRQRGHAGHRRTPRLEKALAAGAVAFLRKPFNDELLIKTLNAAVKV